ncbi:MAG: DUF5683 domain-containing protein [Sphingobacteriales bacterium]|jgi:hypothetical protein
MRNVFRLCILVIGLSFGQQAFAHQFLLPADTIPAKDSLKKSVTDTAKKKERKPQGKAAIRSAIIPGWGQAYNKRYWKIPIVYGALAIPVYTFTYNKSWYDKTREAYRIKLYNDTATVPLPEDNIDPQLQPLSSGSLKIYRDEFRQNMDFSVLAFLVIWGLQVADAAVDAHLKGFNVSDDLSMKVKPWVAPGGRSNGVSLVFNWRESKSRTVLPSY